MGSNAKPQLKGTFSAAQKQNTSTTMADLIAKSDAYEYAKPENVAAREQVKIEAEQKQYEADKQKELSTTQAAILGGVGAARKNRKRPGSLMTSGATDSTIGYGPVGNRKTLLGY